VTVEVTEKIPRIVIAGRPNAGKSTLFNRLLRRRKAIVDPTPGVTRDENRAELVRGRRRFELVDTGGIETGEFGEELAARVHRRSETVLRGADVVVYLLDGKAGLSPADAQVAKRIRALGLPLIFAVNKIDRPQHEGRMIDFLELGDADLVAVSAAHGVGVDDLWTRIEAVLGLPPESEDEDPGEEDVGERDPGEEPADPPSGPEVVRFAFLGRPNVGKSSLLNALAGFDRVLVDPTPGTTRDAIDLTITRGKRTYVAVDTAGLRRKSRIHQELESRAVGASLEALDRADVVVLVLEADMVMSDQDLRLADLVWRHGRGLVIAVNKSDLAPSLKATDCKETVARALPQWPPLPVVVVSAARKRGLDDLLRGIDQVASAFRRKLPTARVNAAVQQAATATPPPLASGRTVKLMYSTQTGTAPPKIVVFVNQGGQLAESYQRYLTHQLRAEFGLVGTPLRLEVRARPRREMLGPPPAAPRRVSRGRPTAGKKSPGKSAGKSSGKIARKSKGLAKGSRKRVGR
jgi:GTP-binding protein